MQVKFKPMRPGAILPSRGTPGAAGLDIYVPQSERTISISPKQRCQVPSGWAIEIPPGYAVLLMSRSGQGHKSRVRLSNSVGLIDSDFRGELLLSLTNDGTEHYDVEPGQAIGQIVFVPILDVDIVDVGTDGQLSDTERGANGFGSTDGAGITSLGIASDTQGNAIMDVHVADPTDVAAVALGAASIAPVRSTSRPQVTQTHTCVEMAISGPAFAEIENKLRIHGYDHLFEGNGIHMHGIILVKE